MSNLITGAIFSPCQQYRYGLWRMWDGIDPRMVMFIGLNPSTADETKDDPTIRRCVGFAKRWGYGGIWMVNLFGFRATDPKEMMRCDDPVGPENDQRLLHFYSRSSLVIAAWGQHGKYRNRAANVMRRLHGMHCLGRTKDGFPRHPLYVKGCVDPQPFDLSARLESADSRAASINQSKD